MAEVLTWVYKMRSLAPRLTSELRRNLPEVFVTVGGEDEERIFGNILRSLRPDGPVGREP